MTREEIRTMLVAVDPAIRRGFSMEKEEDYTYWEEPRRLPLLSDDVHDEAWRFYVHRYTQDEADPVAERLMEALEADDRVSVSHTIDYDREEGWIHHIFECEGY